VTILGASVGADPGVLPGAAVFFAIGLGAFFLPLAARRLRVPAVVLEIVFGVVIGPSVLGIVGEHTRAESFVFLLAELGLLLLMFLAGFEIDFSRLEREGVRPILWGLAAYVLVVVAAWFGLGLLPLVSLRQHVFLTLLVSAASLGIIVPALRAAGRVHTRQGQLTLVIGVLAEFLSAAGIVLFGVFVERGLGWELLAIPGFVLIGAVVLVAMRRIAWWYPEWAERLFERHDPDELGIRAGLALLFVFVGLALAFGIDSILGAFLAGAMFAFVFRDTGELEARLGGLSYGFFIPVFFISVGVRFPVADLGSWAVLGIAGGIIAVAVAAKVVVVPILVWRGLGFREALGSVALLAGQLSVVIALAEFGLQLGVIDETLAAAAVLLVAVTAVGAPVAFRLLSPPPGEAVGGRSASR